MDILNLIPGAYERFMVFILVFTRISSLLSTFVLFRRELITGKIIISLSAILATYVLMNNQIKQTTGDLYSVEMITQMILQIFIGLISGLILNLVFEVFVAFGQVVSTQVGLGFASMIDPRFGSISNLTHFYMISTALIFLFLNGHLFILKTIIDSFTVLPLYQSFVPTHFIAAVVDYSSIIFSGSILLSITIIVAILLTNFSLAAMTKFAPQFNLFSIGINMTLVIGLICCYLTYHIFISQGTNIMMDCLSFMQRMFEGLR